jgi:uncharacterized membrane protein YgdD (TMEM256/DUF423 family)
MSRVWIGCGNRQSNDSDNQYRAGAPACSKSPTISLHLSRCLNGTNRGGDDCLQPDREIDSTSQTEMTDDAENDILPVRVIMSVSLFRLATALCFLAVALGAFGAHGLKATLQAHQMVSAWEKAVFYHFVHALALLFLVWHGVNARVPSWFFLTGIILFSGSLYLMAVTNVRWLGAITPVGGVCFLAGWAWLFFAPPRS